MSVSSGTSPINTAFLDKWINQLRYMENANCDQLLMMIGEVVPLFGDLLKAISKEMASLTSLIALLDIPFPDPVSIVKWLVKLVLGSVGPQITALVNYAVALITLAAKLAELIVLVEELIPKVEYCFTEFPNAILNTLKADVDGLIYSTLNKIDVFQAQLTSLDPTHFTADILIDTSSPTNFLATASLNSQLLLNKVNTYSPNIPNP
jgi:hypothetical protein